MKGARHSFCLCLASILLLGSVWGASPFPVPRGGKPPTPDLYQAIQQIRHTLTDLKQEVNIHEGEIQKIEERSKNQEDTLDTLQSQLSKQFDSYKGYFDNYSNETTAKFHEFDQLIRSLEDISKGLVTDARQLKTQSNELLAALNASQERLGKLEKIVEAQTKHIEQIDALLQSMIETIGGSAQSSSEKTYKVQPGDSLGKIAQSFKVSLKALREANGLKDDKIRQGQTLKIP